MHRILRMASLALVLVLALVTFMPPPKMASAQAPGMLEIDGDVNMPMNLTYAELSSLPMVSEVAKLQCIEGWYVTYNWTGVPLFYLLTLAEMKPDAYKVVTSCSDGYTSDLLVQDALNPMIILALGANGTSLPQLTYGPEGPYRLVVPGKYGYKWSSGVQEITVVTTDYKGYWESNGFSDVADVPNYGPMPTPTPPVQSLNVAYGNRTFQVGAFTDASITVSSFDASLKTLNMDVTVPLGTLGFADLILQQNFLSRPYNVTLDGKAVSPIEADTNTSSYLYLALQEGSHTMSISAAEFQNIPEAIVYYPASIGVGQNATFDASKSVDVGRIVSYQWSFGDGINGTGPIVTHSYSKAGTYQVTVNVTNNQDVSDLQTFTITVGSGINIVLLSKVLLAAMLAALILIFALLLTKRRKPNQPDKENSTVTLYTERNQFFNARLTMGRVGRCQPRKTRLAQRWF
ncbi:MAG: molybdopterin-dependent oxidoreductase [Candidatus Bathyarchaeia archaeon]